MAIRLRSINLVAWLLMTFSAKVVGQNATENAFNAKRTLNIGIVGLGALGVFETQVLFPGFEPLDVFGPLGILVSLSYYRKMTLSTIAHQAGPISAGIPPDHTDPPMDMGWMIKPAVLATHSFLDAPALDVILVPGGVGLEALNFRNDTSVEDFVASRYPQLDYLLSVCTGSQALAKSGVLKGKKATTNKRGWAGVVRHGEDITWVPSARWVQDGNIWTSSGVSAGIDMTYAFLRHIYGDKDEALVETMNTIEYAPHTDAHWDPFSVVHKVPGADTERSLKDCVVPVGY